MAPTQSPTVPQTIQTTPAGYVLPAPPRGRATLLVSRPGAEADDALELAALRATGNRMQVLIECQQQFFAELRAVLAEVDGGVHDEPRARIKRQVAQVGEILDWCDRVQDDLLAESQRAAAGCEPVDLAAALQEAAAGGREELLPTIHVAGQAPTPWWGSRRQLAQALHLALQVVAARIGGAGALQLELCERDAEHTIRVLGLGEPREFADAAMGRDFRAAVEAVGITVSPDELGAGGSGLLLHLPRANSTAG